MHHPGLGARRERKDPESAAKDRPTQKLRVGGPVLDELVTRSTDEQLFRRGGVHRLAVDVVGGSAQTFDALDNDLLANHIRKLKAGEPIELPLYDFKTHNRLNETRKVEPKPIVIVEGILIFVDPRLLEQLDIKVFVDTPDDIRFIRRLRRDIAERGRTVESVIEQYLATVRPMHMQFIEPSKRYADVIIPEGGHNLVSIDLISGTIRERLASALTSVGGQA